MPEARLLTKQKSLSACTYGLPLYVGGFVWKKIKMIAGDRFFLVQHNPNGKNVPK
jgi:hypothetical protein